MTSADSQTPETKPRRKNLARPALLNSVASVLYYGVRVIVNFILNPILVAGLGVRSP